MRIKIKNIRGKGFMSFQKDFSFPVQDYEGKLILIDGQNLDDELSKSNGSGKSTLLETFGWGLYGELCRKNKYVDEVINKQNHKASIIISFSKGTEEWEIERTIFRKKSPDLKIIKNGEVVWNQATYRIKQEQLERVLGMNFVAFQCSDMFGSNFMNFPDLKPPDRAKILSDIRGLGKYMEASKKSSEIAKELAEITQNLQLELRKREGILQSLRSTSYKTNIESWDRQKKENIFMDEEEIESLKDSLKKIQEENKTKIQELEKENQSFINSEKFLNKKLEELKKASNDYSDINIKIHVLKNSINLKDKEIDKLKREMNKWETLKEGPCSNCGQPITGELLKEMTNLVKLDVIKLEKENDTYLKEMDKLNNQISYLLPQIKEISETEQLLRKNQNLQNDIKTKIKVINMGEKEKAVSNQIEGLKQRIEKDKKEINPYIEIENKRIQSIKDTGADIRKIQSDILIQEKERKYYVLWTDGFKKIRMTLFGNMVEHLEDIAQAFLSQYSSELQIVINTERETKSGTIKDEIYIGVVDIDGNEMSYEMYSGGEKQKVRLSIARALAQFIKDFCGIDYNFIAFDEPNDALDDVGKETNFETFNELAENDNKAVFVTDHDATFKDKFDENITIIKENKMSKILLN